MRYIVVFLLIANLSYLGWIYASRQQPVGVAPAPPQPLLNTGLTLLREYEAGASAAAPVLSAPPSVACLPGVEPSPGEVAVAGSGTGEAPCPEPSSLSPAPAPAPGPVPGP